MILLPIKGLFQIFVTSRNYNIDSCDANSNCSWKQSATSFVLLRRLFLLSQSFLNLIPGFLRQICWVHRERKLNLQFSNFKLLLQSSIKQNSNPPHPAKIVTILWTWSVIRNQFFFKEMITIYYSWTLKSLIKILSQLYNEEKINSLIKILSSTIAPLL